jgi:hypothetical protein
LISVKIVREPLDGDAEDEQPNRILTVTLWTPSNAAALHPLAVAFGAEAARLAEEAVRHLAVLHELARGVQDGYSSGGLDGRRFPRDRWKEARQGAERSLTSLHSLLDRQRESGDL